MAKANPIIRLFALLLGALLGGTAWAEQPTPAQSAIPFDALSQTNKTLVKGVTDHYTLRRPYAAQTMQITQTQLEWMLDNLHPTWVLAREFGLPVRTTKPDDQGRLWNDNGDGAKGYIIPVHKTPGKRVYYMQGTQKKVVTVHGRGVIIIDYKQTAPGQMQVSGAQFVKVDNAMMAAITQLLGPLLCGMVDQVYTEFTAPLAKLGATATASPEKLHAAIDRLPNEQADLLRPLADLLAPRPKAKQQPSQRAR